MALNRCERKSCGTLFSVGAPKCPVCRGKRYHEEGAPPKKPPTEKTTATG